MDLKDKSIPQLFLERVDNDPDGIAFRYKNRHGPVQGSRNGLQPTDNIEKTVDRAVGKQQRFRPWAFLIEDEIGNTQKPII